MKETAKNGKNKFVLVLIFVVIIAIGVVLFFLFNKKPGADKTAIQFLTQMFTCTQEDCEEFEKALTGGSQTDSSSVGISNGGDEALRAYFSEKYSDMMTEQGLEKALMQRVLPQGLMLADQNQTDLKVQNVELSGRTASSDAMQFNFTVTTADTKDNTFEITGVIGLVEQDGQFKVNQVSVDQIA